MKIFSFLVARNFLHERLNPVIKPVRLKATSTSSDHLFFWCKIFDVNKRVINNLNNYSIYPLASRLITHRLYRYNHLGFHPPNRHKSKYMLNVPHTKNISLWLWFQHFRVPELLSSSSFLQNKNVINNERDEKTIQKFRQISWAASIEVWLMIRQTLD